MYLLDVAGVELNPGGILAWLIVGILAGAIAGRIVVGRGFGCLTDLVVGVIGAFVGGFVVSIFTHGGTYGLIGSIIVAVLGATIFLAVLRLLSGGRVGRRP